MGVSLTKYTDENLETYCLIWLDALVNTSRQNIQAQEKLRKSVNDLLTFENDQECREYIESLSKDDRVIFIVSGRLGQIIVPEIFHLRQITYIYVYCMDKKSNEQWAQHFLKVKGVFTRLDELIDRLKIDLNQRQHFKLDETLSVSIINFSDHTKEKSSTELNGQFLHSQLLIDCLLRMKPSPTDRNDLINFCKQYYRKNRSQLRIIKAFERNYSSHRALSWYTRHSFLYRLLNKALRVQNIDLLYLFRFFIRDLDQQLRNNKCLSTVRVYRGQLMSKEEIQMLRNAVGKLISTNSFLSTSLNRQNGRSFLSRANSSDHDEYVFFEINADPRMNNIKPFGNIGSASYYPNEEEVLFMIGSIFCVVEMNYDDDDKVWNIKLGLCSNDDNQLQPLFQYMNNELGARETTLLSFGHVLRNMGKLDDAEKYFVRFLNQLPENDPDIPVGYYALGMVAEVKGDYDMSLKWYNKRLEIDIRTLQSDDPNLANTYNNMANIYRKIGDHERALDSYEKASLAFMKAFGENNVNVAICLNSMGVLYRIAELHWEALRCHQKALLICETFLPPDHHHLGSIHNNIGIVHRHLANDDLALEHYHLSLKIKSKSLPPEHPFIAMTLKNIGNIHESKGELEEALSYFEQAATIYRNALPSTNSNVLKIKDSIKRISFLLK